MFFLLQKRWNICEMSAIESQASIDRNRMKIELDSKREQPAVHVHGNNFKNTFRCSTLFISANKNLIKNHLSSKNSKQNSLEWETSFHRCPSLQQQQQQQHSMNTCSIIIIYEVIREPPTLSLTMSGSKLLCVIGPDRDPVNRALILKSTDTHLSNFSSHLS